MVIGGGSAGLVAAYVAATLRASVTVVEQRAMGGDCLNTGCVPPRRLSIAPSWRRARERRPTAGVHVGEARIDFDRVIGYVHQAVRTVAPHDSEARYRGLGVDVQRGHARIVSPAGRGRAPRA